MLYEASDIGASPEAPAIEAKAIQESIRHPGNAGVGQGIALTALQRRAVELRAMKVAEEYLKSIGFKVKDVSQSRSYDLLATKDGAEIIVEVKGSTGRSDAILLTANEVAAHKKLYPSNALIIVHSITLDRRSDPPQATAGQLVAHHPWKIEESNLKPIAYQYGLAILSPSDGS